MSFTLPTIFFYFLKKKNFFFFNNMRQFNNNFYLTIKDSNINLIFSILKFNSFTRPTLFLELSAFDINFKNLNMLLHVFLIFNLKLKLYLFCKNMNNFFFTCSNLFFNSTWSEREISEMHNIEFENKNDSRHIVLDYSFIGNPLKKTYSIIGYTELSYNFITAYIEYVDILLQESIKLENIFDF